MEPPVLIETTRLRFRAHQSSDESDFVKAQLDPEFRRYLGGEPRTLEDATRRFKNVLQKKPHAPFGMWAVVSKGNGSYVGYCTLRREGDGVHLGYCIIRPYWKQGFGYETARALTEIAKAEQLVPVRAEVEQGNVASERILEKLGFARVREEHLPHSGRRLMHFELSRADGS